MLNLRGFGTVALSVVLSLVLTLSLDRYRHPKQESTISQVKKDSDVLRARKIELTDEKGAVRSTLELNLSGGHEQPQFTMTDEKGKTAVILTLNQWGQGFISFNSDTKEGKVMLGYIETGDTAPSYNDSTGSWGVRILGMNGQATGVGILNSGIIIQQQLSSK